MSRKINSKQGSRDIQPVLGNKNRNGSVEDKKNDQLAAPGSNPPGTQQFKRQTKLQIAQQDYNNKVAYNFMQGAQAHKAAVPTHATGGYSGNYWTENAKIIQSYAVYYENEKQQKLMRLRQTRSINQPMGQYDSVEQIIQEETMPTQRSKNDLHQRDHSEKYTDLNNTKMSQGSQFLGQGSQKPGGVQNSQSVPSRKGINYQKSQKGGLSPTISHKPKHKQLGFDIKEQCQRLLLPAQEPPFNPNISNSVLKQAYLFPDISQSGGYTAYSVHQKKKNTFQDQRARGSISGPQSVITNQNRVGQKVPAVNSAVSRETGGTSGAETQRPVVDTFRIQGQKDQTPIGMAQSNPHIVDGVTFSNQIHKQGIQEQQQMYIQHNVETSQQNMNVEEGHTHDENVTAYGNDGTTTSFNNVMGSTGYKFNAQALGVSNSLESSSPYIRNPKARNVRNFKYLYESRNQSERLKQMAEKYRIGDGSSRERLSMQIYNQGGVNNMNDTSSVMYNTGQAFFNAKSNGFQFRKHPGAEYTPQVNKSKALPPIQNQPRTIFGKPLQSVQSPKRHGDQIKPKTGSQVDQQYVEKVISRDQNGKMDIDIKDYTEDSIKGDTESDNKARTQLHQYGLLSQQRDVMTAENQVGAGSVKVNQRRIQSIQEEIPQLMTKISHVSSFERGRVNNKSISPIQEEENQNVLEFANKLLGNVKPVLRRQMIHNSKSVFIYFKSIEVQLVEEKIDAKGRQSFRYLNPVYVPIEKLESYLQHDKVGLELRILKSLYRQENAQAEFQSDSLGHLLQNSLGQDSLFKTSQMTVGGPDGPPRKFIFMDNEDIANQNMMNQSCLYQQKFLSKKFINAKKKRNRSKQPEKLRSRLTSKLSNSEKEKIKTQSCVNASSRADSPQKSIENPHHASINSLHSGSPSSPRLGNQQDQILHKIKTHLLTIDNTEYKVIITMPRLEYSIQNSEHFTFIKTLDWQEVSEYMGSFFHDWHNIAIKHLMYHDLFREQLLDMQNRVQNNLVVRGSPQKKKNNGVSQDPMNIEDRNYRLSKIRQEKSRDQAKKSHSFIPGQCKHAHISQERDANPAGVIIDQCVHDLSSENEDDAAGTLESKKQVQPCIFEMREKLTFYSQDPIQRKIIKYSSIQDYEEYNLLHQNVSNLRGCFDRDNTFGQIHLSTFNITIKSLVTNFVYTRNIKLDKWIELTGYMKKQIGEDSDNPNQLVDKITKVFEKRALRDQQDKFDLSHINLKQYKPFFNSVQRKLRQKTLDHSTGNDVLAIQALKKKLKIVQNEFMKLQNRSKLITVNPIFNKKEYLGKNTEPLPVERYLIEITYPQVQVAYKDKVYAKQLDEIDIEYLIRAKFQGWMQYMINSHFRVELNVGQDQPIPRLQEFLTLEEKTANEKLKKNDMELQDAMVRDDVQFGTTNEDGAQSPTKDRETQEQLQTRNKLNKWFPV